MDISNLINGARPKFFLYSGFSTVLAVFSVLRAFSIRPSFYSACIELAQGLNVIILGNWLLVMTVIIGKALQMLLFGELRIIEIEHIYDRAWFTITNSLVEVAMFRSEPMPLLAGFTLLQVFSRVFHWILVDRMDFIQQRATKVSDIFKSHIFWLVSFFIGFDFTLAFAFSNKALNDSAIVYLLFSLDFALSGMDLTVYLLKLFLNMYEMSVYQDTEEEIWESKTFYSKIVEIIHSSLKVLIHALLFYVLLSPYRIPIHLVRGTFVSIKDLIKQSVDLRRYLRAAKELDTLLADANEEDLERDNLCIICREDMTTVGIQKGSRNFPKKLNCGHIIHIGCLKDWLERSHSCPMCRQPVLNNTTTTNRASQSNGPQANVPPAPQADDGIRVRGFDDPIDLPATPTIPISEEDEAQTSILSQIPNNVFSTTSGASSSSNSTSFQTTPNPPLHSITLPASAALLPPDWTLIPLTMTSQNEYSVHLSPNSTGRLRVVNKGDEVPAISSVASGIARSSAIGRYPNDHGARLEELEKKVSDLQDQLDEMKKILERK